MTLRPKIEVAIPVIFAASASICSCASTAKTAAPGQSTDHRNAPKLIAIAEHLPPMAPPSREKPLLVVYPRGGEIPTQNSFVVGSTVPGYQVTINGAAVAVNKQGFFAHVVSLKPGKNSFSVVATSPEGAAVTTVVEAVREKPPAVMSESIDSLGFDKGSIKPKDDQARTAGDIIELSCRATPGSRVTANLGGRTIPMVCPAEMKSAKLAGHGSAANQTTLKSKLVSSGINPGLSAAYGQMFQRYPAHRPDLYVGLYKIQPEDNFVDAPLSFKIQKEDPTTHQKKETSITAAAKITALKQPLTAVTVADDTIIRTAPDAGRLTPLPGGVRLLVDGFDGENIRCLYRAGKHVWIKKSALQMEESGAPAPNSVARTIIVKKDNFGESVVIPLSQRLPFTIEQTLKPNRLILKLYGVSAETDWVYQAPMEDDNALLVDNVSWKQPDDGTYEVSIDLKNNRQWGFFAEYGQGENENSLILHIKNAPHLMPSAQTGAGGKLAGLTVCLDPGHGGAELGAIGPSGVREAEINLAIALKVKAQLQKEGATVYMTREDDTDVSLDDRVAMAKARGVDLLISIHNNALPDGRDPIKEHGTSTYYYHPQSQELAQVLKAAMAKGTQLQPTGARYQNLALCRPSGMQAVLVEVGFMVNPDEYALLLDPAFQQKAAASVKDGLITYFGRD
ncbi:MAG: N-acetylmuramoyl-L-alanine amidase [Cyanobacteria bacterium SZAS TMP-1]|nr:N-acetylmuramoyl-L-alanine amidase [Cyanobacteria bacterium SZAS TMP-1]